MQVRIESFEPGITIMHLTDALEMSNVAAFRQTLQAEIERAERGFILQLAAVKFIDSSGIAVLIEGLRWSRERDLHYILVHLTSDVQMVLELARLDNFFTIADDLEAAIALMSDV
ncbi:MAG: STAS domain-containing protein [bacterium]|nr:STAS domain-containing protein [bacterium]